MDNSDVTLFVLLFLLVELLVACCELEFELIVVNAVFLFLAARSRDFLLVFDLFVADA